MDDVSKHLVLLQESKKCKIFRPNVYLFVKLKLERLSETDLEDCIQFIKKHQTEYQENEKMIKKIISEKLKKASNENKQRLIDLQSAILDHTNSSLRLKKPD
jgi:hypothetical protein